MFFDTTFLIHLGQELEQLTLGPALASREGFDRAAPAAETKPRKTQNTRKRAAPCCAFPRISCLPRFLVFPFVRGPATLCFHTLFCLPADGTALRGEFALVLGFFRRPVRGHSRFSGEQKFVAGRRGQLGLLQISAKALGGGLNAGLDTFARIRGQRHTRPVLVAEI